MYLFLSGLHIQPTTIRMNMSKKKLVFVSRSIIIFFIGLSHLRETDTIIFHMKRKEKLIKIRK